MVLLMKNLIILLIILLILLILLILKNINRKNPKVVFDSIDYFLNQVNKYDKVIICGNSPKFLDSFKKIKNTEGAFIIRFNAVLDYLPRDSKTNALFVNKYRGKDGFKINKWQKNCKVSLGPFARSQRIFTQPSFAC
jgi:hypothetical protein